MERYRLNTNFNGAPPPPKPNCFLNHTTQISLPPKPHLKDPPITPYLQPHRPNPADGDRLRQTADDSDLSIFEAERYFNEGEESNQSSKRLTPIAERRDLSPKTSLDGFGRTSRNRSFHTTPTVSSEASWNSRTELLKTPPGLLSVSVRNLPVAEQRKASASTGRRFFRRRCPCSGKKSVDVEESCSDPKTPIRSSFESSARNPSLIKAEHEVEKVTKIKVFTGILPKEQEPFHFTPEISRRTVNSGGFSFPILAPSKEAAVEDTARNSLEVFRPNDGTASPVQRKSADFQISSDRRSFNIPVSPKLRSPVDDDLASDASSDLFEIESLSTQMNFRRRDSLDDLSSSALETKKIAESLQLRRSVEEECYAPSEVSVEWSVTTAEGFDRASVANFSSAVSEFDELRFEAVAGEGKKKGIGGGGLLSCHSEKAVCAVAPNLMRFGPERRTGAPVFAVKPDPVVGLARLGAVNPIRDGGGLVASRSVRMNRMVQPINARVY